MAGAKAKLLNHFKALQPVLKGLGAVAYLNALDFKLVVRFGNVEVPMHPQFIEHKNQMKRYTPEFGPGVRAFIGWLPYFNRRWDISTEKLKFKAFVVKNGLPTPEYSTDPGWQADDVIVKKSTSSFGLTIRGPFRRAGEHRLDAAGGEYYEKYMPGRIVKIWYWNERPVCLEMDEHAKLVGDGVGTVRELAMERLRQLNRRKRKYVIDLCADFVAYQGLALDAVPEAGREFAVDYRYGSMLGRPEAVQDVDLEDAPMPEIADQLKRIGETLFQAVPAQMQQGTLFTVDAILDRSNKLWVLEMNSNPIVHPFTYSIMLSTLAERAQHFRLAPPPAPPPNLRETEAGARVAGPVH